MGFFVYPRKKEHSRWSSQNLPKILREDLLQISVANQSSLAIELSNNNGVEFHEILKLFPKLTFA